MALRAINVSTSEIVQPDEAFERLFIQEYRRCVAVAYGILADAQEAEDVAQEAFVSFHGRHDPAAPFAAAWLHRAASHLALNAIRSKRRRERREREEALAHSRIHDARSTALDPSASLERAEQQRLVRDVLRRIPRRSAMVLSLRYSGLSYAEVASALGCRAGDVGTMLRRAEKAFRKESDRETHL